MAKNDTETETESFEDVISAEGGAFKLTAEQRVKVTAFYAGKGLTGEDLTSAVDVFEECVALFGWIGGPEFISEELRSVGAE